MYMNAEDQFSDDGGVPLHHLKTRAARGMTFKILYFADILSVYTDRFFGVDVMRSFFVGVHRLCLLHCTLFGNFFPDQSLYFPLE